MIGRRFITVLLMAAIALAVNAWPQTGAGYYVGGVHRWTESREIGWPCPVAGFLIEFQADYGNPIFSQPTIYHWTIHWPKEVVWYGAPWFSLGVHVSGIMLNLTWWISLGWFLCWVICRQQWQFGMKELMLLPVLIGSAFFLSSLF
ncbi:hypothetical protein C5Y96_09725 [Blastopirellula marina]|uniref:Uncharacterized protein n=1 Tax=Blastopirellula marina TaxID=124 RepID=A0A2S8FSZ1_9BACT|nr:MULTISPECIES: hypothetical protein [Pirellulaceae]PQO35302.1 hypothetical protein C5Y96_09725 [Blastopirellula marina]RCS53171.1 hypothetical protein DTL36_09735 [Bremerella cremea]